MLRTIVGTLLGIAMVGCGHNAGGVDIWEAVEQDDRDAIRKYMLSGGDVNVIGWDGSTPLWTALDRKKRLSYEALLDYGADPNIIMRGKRVVTHWAVTEEDPWWLRLALEHGADPNLVNVGYFGRPTPGPPLMYALGMRGTLENVKLLVEHGARFNRPLSDSHYPAYPLAVAAGSCKFDIVLYLLEQGADYDLAEYADEPFLDRIKHLHRHKDEWFILKFDRDKINEIYAWLKARGVEFDED